MKNFNLFFATILITLATSCQSDYFDFNNQNKPSEQTVLSRSKSNKYFPDGWQYLETNNERWTALQLHDSVLTSLSTQELVDVCMSYPLAHDIFAFNDVEYGLQQVISRFNGFAELKTRNDAFDKMLDFYACKLDEIETLGKTIGYVFKPLSLAFYERFICSGYLCAKDQLSSSEKLNSLFQKAVSIHDNFIEMHGHTTTESLGLLKNLLGFDNFSRFSFSDVTKVITTNGGLSVYAIFRVCVDPAADIAQGIKEVQEKYPNVVIIDDATCTYNCHAYAWWVSEGGDKCWINKTHAGSENVSKFFSDGTFIQTSSPKSGDKVFYSKDDHSAIVYSGDTFTSKWGSLCLVRHKYNDCPYNSTGLVYYKVKPEEKKYGTVYWDMTPDPTPVNSYEDFYINDSYDLSKYRIEIFVSKAKEPTEPIEDTSKAYIVSSTHNRAKAYFAATGIYHVCFMVYNKTTGEHVGEYVSEQIYVF